MFGLAGEVRGFLSGPLNSPRHYPQVPLGFQIQGWCRFWRRADSNGTNTKPHPQVSHGTPQKALVKTAAIFEVKLFSSGFSVQGFRV